MFTSERECSQKENEWGISATEVILFEEWSPNVVEEAIHPSFSTLLIPSMLSSILWASAAVTDLAARAQLHKLFHTHQDILGNFKETSFQETNRICSCKWDIVPCGYNMMLATGNQYYPTPIQALPGPSAPKSPCKTSANVLRLHLSSFHRVASYRPWRSRSLRQTSLSSPKCAAGTSPDSIGQAFGCFGLDMFRFKKLKGQIISGTNRDKPKTSSQTTNMFSLLPGSQTWTGHHPWSPRWLTTSHNHSPRTHSPMLFIGTMFVWRFSYPNSTCNPCVEQKCDKEQIAVCSKRLAAMRPIRLQSYIYIYIHSS